MLLRSKNLDLFTPAWVNEGTLLKQQQQQQLQVELICENSPLNLSANLMLSGSYTAGATRWFQAINLIELMIMKLSTRLSSSQITHSRSYQILRMSTDELLNCHQNRLPRYLLCSPGPRRDEAVLLCLWLSLHRPIHQQHFVGCWWKQYYNGPPLDQ